MLILKNLVKIYKMGSISVHALDGINLNIKKNEFIAIMGASGSGKSTLMNILGCLDTPTQGSYILNKKEVGNLNDDELARIRNSHLGFVFQSFNLLPRLNAEKNISLPLKYSDFPIKNISKRVFEMLKKVGLEKRSEHKPSELSGGERQRVAIARARYCQMLCSPLMLHP